MRKRKLSNYYGRTDFNITFVMLTYIFLGMLLNYFKQIPFLLLLIKILLIVFTIILILTLVFKRTSQIKLYLKAKVYLHLVGLVVAPFILIGIGLCYHESSLTTKADSHGVFTFPLKNDVYESVISQLNLDDSNVLLHFTTGLENKTIDLQKDELHLGYYALTASNSQLEKPKLTSPYLEINKKFQYDLTLEKGTFIMPLPTLKTHDVTYTLRIPLEVQGLQ